MYEKTKLKPKNKMLMIRARGKLSTEVKLSFNQRFLSGGIFKFSRETILYMSFDTLVSHPREKRNTPSRFTDATETGDTRPPNGPLNSNADFTKEILNDN